VRISDSEELARKERRRRLTERLNEKEKLLGSHDPARGVQMRNVGEPPKDKLLKIPFQALR
jgi:hypothetical protein